MIGQRTWMNQHLVGQDIMNELESMIVEHKSNTPKRDNTNTVLFTAQYHTSGAHEFTPGF